MSDEVRAVLKKAMPQLDDNDLDQLVQSVRVSRYPPKTKLCEQGKEGDTFYVLIKGNVDIIIHAEGNPRRVDTLGEGEYFGEIALILNVSRSADVITTTNVQVIEIDRETFRTHLQQNAQFVAAMNEILIKRLLNQEQKMIAALPATPGLASSPDVFVSYARQDRGFVHHLIADLSRRNINVWLDEKEIEPGANWPEAIQQAMDRCHVMLVVLSKAAVESRHVSDEWHYFLDEAKPVVPVLHESCRIPYQLRRIQYIDFGSRTYDVALQQLITILRSRIG